MRLEWSVYGQRHAPRSWWRSIERDMLASGRRAHHSADCVRLAYHGGRLVGFAFVYADGLFRGGCFAELLCFADCSIA
eukprot:15442893-Alexandrium_andersonii.AAC.1